jgi:hypothetical protein
VERATGPFGDSRGLCRVLVGKPEGINHSEDPDIEGKIILRWIFRRWDAREYTGSVWLWIGTGGGHM